jgi:glycosyltransferase involved in cell wall biosynthesis
VGRLAEQKGHTYILQAMPLIRRMIPAHLAVIGTGSLDSTLQAEAQRLGIQDSVHFLGSRNDVLEILPHLDLIVSASLWEGLPAAILEAMTVGVPVLATDVSGSREVVQTGRTGILVPVADPAALAQAAITLLTDRSEALRMAQNARQIAALYTVQNAAPCYGQVYETLVAGKH